MLYLRTFGNLSLDVDGCAAVGAGAQRRPLAILAVIAASGERGISRERLQALFWPDSDAEKARGGLKQALYALRRDLKVQDLTLGTSELSLNAAVIASDIHAFRMALSRSACEKAAAAYAGPFLDGIQFRNLDEFERWSSRERDVLSKQYQGALESLAKQCALTNDYHTAAKWWAALASVDPYSSRVAVEFMRALAMAGRREAAIQHGHLHRRFLKRELNAEPDQELVNLVTQLKRGADNSFETEAPLSFASSSLVSSTARLDRLAVDAANTSVNGSQIDLSTRSLSATGPGLSKNGDRVRTPRFRLSSLRWVMWGGGLAVALVGANLGFSRWRGGEKVVPTRSNRLIVIPFENRTGDRSLDALGSLTADWVTDGLERVQLIPVVDPATVSTTIQQIRKESNSPANQLKRIAQLTDASALVSGSFYRRGDSIEFHVRVSDGVTERILGSIDPVTVPAAVPGKGVEMVRPKVLGLLGQLFDARLAQIQAPGTRPPAFAAYKEFVSGVDEWAKEGGVGGSSRTTETKESAKRYFQRAYALDTTFATALVWAVFTYDDPIARAKLLDTLAARRDRLTPLDRHAVDYFSAESKSDMPAEIAAAEAASDLAPRSEWSWNAAQLLYPLNRPREALRYFSRLDLDRGWMGGGYEYCWYLMAQTTHMLGDLNGTLSLLTRARKRFPQNVPIAAAYARALALAGQADSVSPIVREILRSDNDWRTFYVYSILADLQRHGKNAEANAIYDQVAPWYTAKGQTALEWDRGNFGRILIAMQMWPEATTEYRAILRDFPKSIFRPNYLGQLAVLAAKRGDTIGAVRLVASLPTKDGWQRESNYWKALVATELGHRAEAVSFLQASFTAGYPQISLSHSFWYDFPKLQGYPPFEALVAPDK